MRKIKVSELKEIKMTGEANHVVSAENEKNNDTTVVLPENNAPIPDDQAGDDRKSGVKRVGCPRYDKNLAVLGVEDLLCDIRAQSESQVGRPFLHVFLEKLYKHYDIALWSDRSMDLLEQMVDRLGMDKHPEYKLLCYVDKSEKLTLGLPTGIALIKPLETIWREYPNYNQTNTVICDGREDKIIWNFENGIVARPYSHLRCNEDKELIILMSYLKSIAKSINVSKLDHSIWKRKVLRAKKRNCVLS